MRLGYAGGSIHVSQGVVMNTINRRAILVVALFFACGATAAATAPVSTAPVQHVSAPSSFDLPCNPLVCSVKGP